MLRILPLTSAYYKNYYIINIKPFLCGHILKKFIGQLHYFLSHLSDIDSLLQRRKVHALVLVHSPQRRNNITVPDVALQSFFLLVEAPFFFCGGQKQIFYYTEDILITFSAFSENRNWKSYQIGTCECKEQWPEVWSFFQYDWWLRREVTRWQVHNE